jgi:hypothetical protein
MQQKDDSAAGSGCGEQTECNNTVWLTESASTFWIVRFSLLITAFELATLSIFGILTGQIWFDDSPKTRQLSLSIMNMMTWRDKIKG